MASESDTEEAELEQSDQIQEKPEASKSVSESTIILSAHTPPRHSSGNPFEKPVETEWSQLNWFDKRLFTLQSGAPASGGVLPMSWVTCVSRLVDEQYFTRQQFRGWGGQPALLARYDEVCRVLRDQVGAKPEPAVEADFVLYRAEGFECFDRPRGEFKRPEVLGQRPSSHQAKPVKAAGHGGESNQDQRKRPVRPSQRSTNVLSSPPGAAATNSDFDDGSYSTAHISENVVSPSSSQQNREQTTESPAASKEHFRKAKERENAFTKKGPGKDSSHRSPVMEIAAPLSSQGPDSVTAHGQAEEDTLSEKALGTPNSAEGFLGSNSRELSSSRTPACRPTKKLFGVVIVKRKGRTTKDKSSIASRGSNGQAGEETVEDGTSMALTMSKVNPTRGQSTRTSERQSTMLKQSLSAFTRGGGSPSQGSSALETERLLRIFGSRERSATPAARTASSAFVCDTPTASFRPEIGQRDDRIVAPASSQEIPSFTASDDLDPPTRRISESPAASTATGFKPISPPPLRRGVRVSPQTSPIPRDARAVRSLPVSSTVAGEGNGTPGRAGTRDRDRVRTNTNSSTRDLQDSKKPPSSRSPSLPQQVDQQRRAVMQPSAQTTTPTRPRKKRQKPCSGRKNGQETPT